MSILDATIARLDGTPTTLGEITGGPAGAAGQRGEQVRAHPAVHRARGAPGDVRRRGFTVVGCRATSSSARSPGSAEEIAEFCSATYGVTFPMTEKIEVNGDDRHEIYARAGDDPQREGRGRRRRPGTSRSSSSPPTAPWSPGSAPASSPTTRRWSRRSRPSSPSVASRSPVWPPADRGTSPPSDGRRYEGALRPDNRPAKARLFAIGPARQGREPQRGSGTPIWLLGRRSLVLRGPEGVDLFYDDDRVVRTPCPAAAVAHSLFGKGAVHGLDGIEHRHRKQLFLDVTSPAQVADLAERVGDKWQAELDLWMRTGRGTVLPSAVRAMGEAVQGVGGGAGSHDRDASPRTRPGADRRRVRHLRPALPALPTWRAGERMPGPSR